MPWVETVLGVSCPEYELSWVWIVMGTSWPGHKVTQVRVVLGTSCPVYELSWVRVVLGTSGLGYELTWVRVVLCTSRLGYELSWVRVVLGTSRPDSLSHSPSYSHLCIHLIKTCLRLPSCDTHHQNCISFLGKYVGWFITWQNFPFDKVYTFFCLSFLFFSNFNFLQTC